MNKRKKGPLLLVIAVSISLLACGSPKEQQAASPVLQVASTPAPTPPSVEGARQLIADSAEFADFEFTNASWSMPLKKSAMNDPTRLSARELAAAGWITFQGDDVVLTTKAKEDKRWLVRPNGFVDIVPLAKKELTEVTIVTPGPEGTAKASFCWNWKPNEVGSVFKSGLLAERYSSMQCGQATLQPRQDGGWEVLLLESRPDLTAADKT